MNNKISNPPEAIVLCGGKGERLRPITNDVPKPLVRIGGKPILHYVISHLTRYKIKKVHIASGYKSELIEDYFEKNHYKADIEIHNSGDVDIIKRIQDVFLTVRNDALVLYGDTISNVDITDLVLRHRNGAKEVTMTVWPLRIAYGLVEIGDGEIVETFNEKPTLDKWINIGYFVINSNFKEMVFSHTSFKSFLSTTVVARAMSAYRHHGIHITVNTLSQLEEAERNIKYILEDDAQ